MARPRTSFTDAELRGILDAAADADQHDRNDAFLDRFIAGVAHATGRLYGQPLYVRLLDTAGIRRRPSAPTWSAAIARARSSPLPPSRPVAERASSDEPPSGTFPRESRELVAIVRPSDDRRDTETADLKVRVQVTEATLLDAYRRNAALETERKDLLQRVAMAEARERVAERRLQEVATEKDAIAGALTARLEALMATEARLAGLERHLRLQTDQLRTQLSQQVHEYKDRLQAAEKALERERNQTDALRRVLGDRGLSGATPIA
jgi:hypothetical protein